MDEAKTIDRPDAGGRVLVRETGLLQQALQALGDAAAGAAGPEDHDPLPGQGAPQAP